MFRSKCAFCHGLGARGVGRGLDLTRAQKRHGNSDADLFRTINEGIPGTAMPPNGATQQGVGMTAGELWQVIAYIRSVEKKAPAQPPGNAAQGRGLFYGSAACSTCHMVEGKGGRLGPDLTSTGGVRSVEYIIESIRNPSRRLAQGISEAMKEFSQEYETVTVVTSDGQKIAGVVLNEDSFTLQMMDAREQIHLLEKDKLRSFEKSRESLMPAYDMKPLSEKDLQDIVAFLLSVGSQGGVKEEKSDDVLQILFAQGLHVVSRHQGLAALLEGAQLVFFQKMNLFARVHHLQREAVFVQDHAGYFLSVRSHDRHGFILLRELFHRFGNSLRQAAARIADGLDDVFDGAHAAGAREIRPEAASFPFHHVARGASSGAIAKPSVLRRVARRLRRRLLLHAANVGDDLPNLLCRHAHALLRGAIRRHGRAGNALVNRAEEVGIGIPVTFLRAG